MKTIDGIKNALLLTPLEAAGIGVLEPLLVRRGKKVEAWKPLGVTYPCMVGGTDLAAIGENNKGFFLCVRREDLPEVECLRGQLAVYIEKFGYLEAFLRWEKLGGAMPTV